MSEAIQLNTAGMHLLYAVEQTAGVRPTTGYVVVPEVKSTPDFNVSPESLDSTTLAATRYKTYVPGLSDLGGALAFTANMTQLTYDTWKSICDAYDEAAKEGKHIWWTITHPGISDSVYFQGEPSRMGMPAAAVNSVFETTLYITATNEPEWFPKPTES